jgi:hypothetical protein
MKQQHCLTRLLLAQDVCKCSKDLFSADNNRNGSQSEFIFPIVSDGNAIRYWCRNEFYYACPGGSMDLLHVVWTVDGGIRNS